MKNIKYALLALLASATCAFAAVPEEYETAVEGMATDIGGFLTSTFGVLAGVAVIATLGAVLIRKIKAGRSAVALAGLGMAILGAGESFAAVPAAYTTAVSGMATDVGGFLTTTFGVLAGVAVIATLGAVLIRKIKAGRSAV